MQPQKPPFHKPGRVFRTLLAGFLLITGILSQPVHTQAQADAVHARPADSTEVETADRLESIYSRLEGFGGVRVEVIENVVRLTGTVPTSVASEQAETLAKSQDGVDFVINDLTTDVQVRSRLAPAVDRFETYIDSAIAYLPILALALIVLVFFSFLARMAGKLDKPLERTKMPPMTRMLVLRLVSVVIFLVGLVLALDILDVTALVGTILGAAGLAGVSTC